MLILIVIDVQYLQNVAFSFEKYSNGQIHSFSDSHHPSPPSKIAHFCPTGGEFPTPVWNTIWILCQAVAE